MWIKEHTKFYSDVAPEAIWEIWIDINNWHSWHGDLDYCKLDGEFKVGTHFILKPKGAAAVKILLTEINEMQSFTDCTNFFGAKMYDTHSMEFRDNGVILTNRLVVTGPLRWLWVKLVANHVADTASEQMDSLVSYARRR